MSRWLDIARAAKQQSGPSCHVPLVPIVPLGPVRGAFGTNDTNGTWHREAKAAALDLTDLDSIRAFLARLTVRRLTHVGPQEAARLAYDMLLWVWCKEHPARPPKGRCAACGAALTPIVMSLPDGAKVCDTPENTCLIAYGNGRRTEAVNALRGLGIEPPAWWEL